MSILDILADRKIEEAIAEGKLDDLPGKGKPLKLDDDSPLVPREMRAMNRLLKQAGVLPNWVQQAKDTVALDLEIQREQARLLRAHAHWSDELVMIPTPVLIERALKWHAENRARFVELVKRRGNLFRAFDAAAPRGADRSNARSVDEILRTFDKLFPPFEVQTCW